MATFGKTTLPGTILGFVVLNPRMVFEVPIPGRDYAYRKDKGGYGVTVVVEGVTDDLTDRDDLLAMAGTEDTLDLDDGGETFTCILRDPKVEVNQQNVRELRYTLTFVQSA